MLAHSIARPHSSQHGMSFLKSICLGCISITERATEKGRALSISLSWCVCQKGVAKYFEQPCFALAAGTAKGIDRRANADIDETALLKHVPPACTRQATGDSVSPQVDVAQRPRRDFLAVCDVRKLQAPSGFQYAYDFAEDPALVGA